MSSSRSIWDMSLACPFVGSGAKLADDAAGAAVAAGAAWAITGAPPMPGIGAAEAATGAVSAGVSSPQPISSIQDSSSIPGCCLASSIIGQPSWATARTICTARLLPLSPA